MTEDGSAEQTSRGGRLRLAAAGAVAVAAIVATVIVLSGGGRHSSASGHAGPSTPAPLPARRITALAPAARAAGCSLIDPPYEGNAHVTGPVHYRSNPPTSGNHNPMPASDGDYVGQATPPPENLVHSLEHGRIEIQYRPGLPAGQVAHLQELFAEPEPPYAPGQYLLLFANDTGMPYAVAATAWNHLLACPAFNARIFDAIRAFRLRWTFQAPEKQFVQAE